jgi:hypothetical protein
VYRERIEKQFSVPLESPEEVRLLRVQSTKRTKDSEPQLVG